MDYWSRFPGVRTKHGCFHRQSQRPLRKNKAKGKVQKAKGKSKRQGTSLGLLVAISGSKG